MRPLRTYYVIFTDDGLWRRPHSTTIKTRRTEQQCVAVAPPAIVMLVAGMVAAWLAAGSTGLLGHPLQHALTWFALAVAIVAAWPQDNRIFRNLGNPGSRRDLWPCSLTASTLPTVNVLAVAIMLAAIAQVSRGLTGRVALIAALAATALGLFRFACDSIPTVWLAADAKGWMLGATCRLAGRQLAWRLAPRSAGSTSWSSWRQSTSAG